MSVGTHGPRPSVPPGRRALGLVCAVAASLALGACDDGNGPGELPFGRTGRVRIEVSTPLALNGRLQQSITWTSDGPWQLTERILYKEAIGDETVFRSTEDAGTLARRYGNWIALVNEDPGVRLFLPDLPPGFVPSCPSPQSTVTVQIVDAQRNDSTAWTRCGENSLASLAPEALGLEVAASRVIEAAKLVRNFTVPLDRKLKEAYAYTGSRPFRTLAKGEKATVPLLLPRVIEDASTWAAFWAQYMSGAQPAVDFANEIVLVAAVGTRQEAGDSVEVRRILPFDFGTQISLYERRPGDFCTPAPRTHAPFHVVVAPDSLMPRPIFFSVENVDQVPCG